MATDKTKTISGRVPVAVADALEADAAELGVKPGSIVRQMLEGRYSVSRRAEKTGKPLGKSPARTDDEPLEELT